MASQQTKQSSFVVKAFTNTDAHTYIEKDDCTMKLDSDTCDFELVSAADITKVYVKANILHDNIKILSRTHNEIEVTKECNGSPIDLVMTFKDQKFGIRFDERSSASEKIFVSEYSKIVSRRPCVEYYPSGNVQIKGLKTDDGFNGECKMYHDNVNMLLMIKGEFEDDLPDGPCEFYSEDNNICVKCNNICAGKPNGSGDLYVKSHHIKTIQMKDYSDIYVLDPLFTNKIYSQIDPHYQNTIDRVLFKELTIEEKMMYVYDEIQKMKKEAEPQEQEQTRRGIFNLF
jgi:hypothetical protein